MNMTCGVKHECIERASFLNTKGVFALTSGRTEDASSFFADALEALETKKCSVHEDTEYSSLCVFEDGNWEVPTRDLILTMPAGERLADETKNFIYRKAFYFNPSIPLKPADNNSFYRGVVTFNLALSVHCHCIETTGEDESALRLALQLYKQSLTILLRALSFDIVKVTIAAMNNLSNILYDLGKFEKARKSLDDLSKLISVAKESEQSPMDEEDMSEIILNVCLIQEPSCASAA